MGAKYATMSLEALKKAAKRKRKVITSAISSLYGSHSVKSDGTLRSSARLLFYVGLWPESDNKDPHYYLRKMVLFGGLMTTVVQLYEPYNFIATLGKEEDFCKAGNSLAIGLVILVTSLTAYWKTDGLRDLLEGMETLLSRDQSVKDKRRNAIIETSEIYMKRLWKITMTFRVILLCMMTLLAFQSYADGILPFRMWLPYDPSKSPMLEMTILVQIPGLFTSAHIMITVMTYFLVIVIAVISQFEVLTLQIRNLREDAVKNVEERDKMLRQKRHKQYLKLSSDKLTTRVTIKTVANDQLEHTQEIKKHVSTGLRTKASPTNSNGSQIRNGLPHKVRVFDCTYFNTISQTSFENLYSPTGLEQFYSYTKVPLKRKQERVKSNVQRKLDIDTEMKQLLRNCILHQTALMKYVEDLFSIVKPVFATAIISYYILITLLLLYVVITPAVDSIMLLQAFVCLGGSAGLLASFLMIDYLSEQASDLGLAAYSSDWFESTEEYKRTIRILISRANKPLELTVAGFFPISVDSYRKIINAAYKVFKIMFEITRK